MGQCDFHQTDILDISYLGLLLKFVRIFNFGKNWTKTTHFIRSPMYIYNTFLLLLFAIKTLCSL